MPTPVNEPLDTAGEKNRMADSLSQIIEATGSQNRSFRPCNHRKPFSRRSSCTRVLSSALFCLVTFSCSKTEATQFQQLFHSYGVVDRHCFNVEGNKKVVAQGFIFVSNPDIAKWNQSGINYRLFAGRIGRQSTYFFMFISTEQNNVILEDQSRNSRAKNGQHDNRYVEAVVEGYLFDEATFKCTIANSINQAPIMVPTNIKIYKR